MAVILQTARLSLREMDLSDAPFIFAVVNEPAFHRFIGDRGVRSLEDARDYLSKGPLASYARHGFGLWLVETQEGKEPVGMCGLIKRDALNDFDIGYAYLQPYWSHGYATEAVSAVKKYAAEVLHLSRIVAITDPQNHASERVLSKNGFKIEGKIRLGSNEPELNLFGVDLS